jgi:hypothetical protein
MTADTIATTAAGLWAICAIALAPFLSHDQDAFDDSFSFQPMGLLAAALWPVIPLTVPLLLIAAAPVLAQEALSRWWRRAWS